MVAGMHRRGKWIGWVAVGAVLVLGVSGCADEQIPPTSAEASATPTLSEGELVENASSTARAFVQLTDDAFSELEVPADLRAMTTDEIASNIELEVSQYIASGYRLEGSSSLDNIQATSTEFTSPTDGMVELLACLDTSASQVVDAAGEALAGGGTERRPVTFEVRWQNETGFVHSTSFPESDEAEACTL